MTSYALPSVQTQNGSAALTRWITERGILALLLLIPMAAVVSGYALRLIPLPVAIYAVFISVNLITAWVSYRATASDDAHDPVRHLHRYAVYALLAVVLFTLAQIPAFVVADVEYWQLWHDLGAALTRQPPATLWSLAAGVVLYLLVGMSLALSYYVVAPRSSQSRAAIVLSVLVLPAVAAYLLAAFTFSGVPRSPVAEWTFWLAFGVGAISVWVMPSGVAWLWNAARSQASVVRQ